MGVEQQPATLIDAAFGWRRAVLASRDDDTGADAGPGAVADDGRLTG
jgi:hypothetical protein